MGVCLCVFVSFLQFCHLNHAASQTGERRPRAWHRIRGDKGGAVCWSCPLFSMWLPARVDSAAWHRHCRVPEGSGSARRRHNCYCSAVLTLTDQPTIHPSNLFSPEVKHWVCTGSSGSDAWNSLRLCITFRKLCINLRLFYKSSWSISQKWT